MPTNPDGRQSLNHQILADEVIGELIHFSRCDAATLADDAKMLGNPSGEREFLFNQQDGNLPFLIQAQDDIPYLVHDIRLDAFRRFIEYQ
jgi:hypothetical protein